MTAHDKTQHLLKEGNIIQTPSLKISKMQLKIPDECISWKISKEKSVKTDIMMIQIVGLAHKNIFKDIRNIF